MTSLKRTLIDLGSVVEAKTLDVALNDALRRKLTTIDALRARLIRIQTRGRPGVSALRTLLDLKDPRFELTDSELEDEFLRLARSIHLPLPVSQYRVMNGRKFVARVDFAYPEIRLAIEIESRRHHTQPMDWEHDQERRSDLAAVGWRSIHVTSAQMKFRRESLKETLRAVAKELREHRRQSTKTKGFERSGGSPQSSDPS